MQTKRAIRRILVLDDDAFILKTISHALGRLGYAQVVTTSSAAQALTLLRDDGSAVDFVFFGPDGHLKVPHIGRVIIQDDVEIGANTTIDRGGIRDTIIGEFLATALSHYEPGSVSLEITSMIADQDQVVLQWTSRARTLDGRPYENDCIGVFTIRDGRIQGVREYMDTLYAHEVVFSDMAPE